jgi:DNA-directed RNA polymerase subunit K/omega
MKGMVHDAGLNDTGGAADAPSEPAAPIFSRFLFVDVAAQRAKQLRRGALPRLERPATPTTGPRKLERVAMEEVRQGAIHYTLPPTPDAASRSEAA